MPVRRPILDDTRDDGGPDIAAIRALIPLSTDRMRRHLNRPNTVIVLHDSLAAAALYAIRPTIAQLDVGWWAWDGVNTAAAEDVMLEGLLECLSKGAGTHWRMIGIFQNAEPTAAARTALSKATAEAVRARWMPSLLIRKDPDSNYWMADTVIAHALTSMQRAIAARPSP